MPHLQQLIPAALQTGVGLSLFYFSRLWCSTKRQYEPPIFLSATDNDTYRARSPLKIATFFFFFFTIVAWSFYSSIYLGHFQNSLLFMFCSACYKNTHFFLCYSSIMSSTWKQKLTTPFTQPPLQSTTCSYTWKDSLMSDVVQSARSGIVLWTMQHFFYQECMQPEESALHYSHLAKIL